MVKILIGIISGTITAMGMGGGTILIFLLTYIYNINQKTAQATNLIFFIPTAIISIIINIKNKNIDIKTGTIISIFGIIGAIIGANLSINIKSENLKRYFGIFILLIAINEIYSIKKKYKKEKKDKNKYEINKQEGK